MTAGEIYLANLRSSPISALHRLTQTNLCFICVHLWLPERKSGLFPCPGAGSRFPQRSIIERSGELHFDDPAFI
jgi:hypothetical protein